METLEAAEKAIEDRGMDKCGVKFIKINEKGKSPTKTGRVSYGIAISHMRWRK